jgi:hypothetical protein
MIRRRTTQVAHHELLVSRSAVAVEADELLSSRVFAGVAAAGVDRGRLFIVPSRKPSQNPTP